MAKFVLICGPQAVGKMTVGQELAKLTGLKFMHNHETIDLPLKFFEFKSEQRERLTDLFRFSIFEEVAKRNDIYFNVGFRKTRRLGLGTTNKRYI